MSNSQPRRPTAVCILGMHRSGTSTVSRAVNLLGAYLGEDVDIMPPQEDNPEGFWERNDVVAVTDRLLPALHLRWDTPLPLPDGWQRSPEVEPFRRQLSDIIQTAFAGRPLWAWKDPRTCILIDLWQEIVAETGAELVVLFAVRNPFDVAASLRKRNGFPDGKSFGIWFTYNLIALRALRGIRTAFISYDRLLERGEEELRRCAAVLGIPWPADDAELKGTLASFLRPDLRHSKSNDADLSGVPLPVRRLFGLLTDALENAEPLTDGFFDALDSLHGEFNGYVEFFRADVEARFDGDRTIAALQREVSEREQQVANRDRQIEEARRLLDEKNRAIERCEKDYVEKNVAGIVDEFKARCLDLIAGDVSLKSLEEQKNLLAETNRVLKGLVEEKCGELDQANQALHDLETRYKNKCHELVQRDQVIVWQEEENLRRNELSGTLSELELKYEEKCHELIAREKEILAKDQEIALKEEDRIRERDRYAKELELRGTQLQGKEKLLSQMTSELADKNRELDVRAAGLTAKDKEIERLQEQSTNERLRYEQDIAVRDRLVAKKADLEKQLEERLSEKSGQLAALGDEIKRLQEQAAAEKLRYEQDIAVRDRLVAKKADLEKQLEERLGEKTSLLTAREEEIGRLQEQAAAEKIRSGEDIAAQDKLIAEKDMLVEQLEERLRLSQELVAERERNLHTTERALAEQEALVIKKVEESRILQERLEKQDVDWAAEKRDLLQRISEKEQQIEEFLHSFSWKATAPLRKAHELVIRKK